VTSVAAPATAEETWFGHPRGLTILFLTETWDQFSFFGMRAGGGARASWLWVVIFFFV